MTDFKLRPYQAWLQDLKPGEEVAVVSDLEGIRFQHIFDTYGGVISLNCTGQFSKKTGYLTTVGYCEVKSVRLEKVTALLRLQRDLHEAEGEFLTLDTSTCFLAHTEALKAYVGALRKLEQQVQAQTQD